MVTSAKKPRAPRKKKAKAEDEAPKQAMTGDVAPVSEPEDAPLPKSYHNESEDDAADAAPEESGEPDFGLGIGDILRADSSIKRAPKEVAPSVSAKSDAKRLSIDSILRGEAPAQVPASLMDLEMQEEEARAEAETRASRMEAEEASELQAMEPARERGGFLKSLLLFLLVLALFGMAAGGVYMFLSKNGVPSFIADHSSGDTVTPNGNVPLTNEPTGPVVPDTAGITVRIGTKAPATAGTDAFLVSRAIESDGKTSGTFPATGEASSKTDHAVGIATIVNTTGRAYTFVATTRLLSADGVLFRLVKSSNIPANGSVDVEVRADQPGAEGDIGPTTFTIPGLPPDQQKLITAKSEAAMTGGSGTGVKGVSQMDIDAAKAELSKKLNDEAIENFEVMLQTGEKLIPSMVTSKELDSTAPSVGTAGETFQASISLRFNALLVPEKDVLPLIDVAMAEALPEGVSAIDYGLGSLNYTVLAYDTADGVAEVRVEAPIIRR